ncbi:RNA-directed DNA polymerase from mobile element jockey-like [Elysia marginata]|uniref:RNA-directed DNA polymerase from mobile element jockey-like n=1 Tax=Elysia marginata TaxID=1093978 RepID=A0AAV4FWP2_9GAST|nr:RNA-directed DNA polymerase from mobile element jockey-like [Elysia marginata]
MALRRKATQDPSRYKSIDKEIKKMCNEAKEEWINGQCKEIEDCKKADNAYMHQKINDIASKKRTAQGGCIKSKDGKILMKTSDILERWSEYIQELFYDERGQQPETQKPIEGPPILKAEVEKTINDMKNGKAAGPDQIPIELLQALGNWGIDQLTKLLNRIYDTGNIPKDMLISTFITLQKKPGATECENHRTVSLMSHTLKLLLKILLTRIRSKIKPEISETQFGFVANKGTTNAIFTMMMLMERCIETQKDLYLCFIDYSKAFDKVRHEELFHILDSLDIDGKDLRILKTLIWKQTATV